MINRLKNFALLLCSSLVLTACSNLTALINLTVPTEGYLVVENVPYGPEARQMLDIYIPAQQDAKKSVLIFFYGGSWQYGRKEQYLFVGQTFAAKGYVTVIADYRLYPDTSFPAFIDDVARAVVWARQNIQQHGGNPDRLFVSGHSAGAYLAMMLATNEGYLLKAGGKSDWIKGTIGLAGPYDFLPFTTDNITALFSTAAHEADTQPINFVRPNMPPALFLTGLDDRTVHPRNSINMAAKMQELGNKVALVQYRDVNHYTIALSLAHGFYGYSPAVEDISQFINSH